MPDIPPAPLVPPASPRAATKGRSIPAAIHSDVIEEIVEHVPRAVIRWGITAWSGLLLLLLGISYWIKYPDLVTGDLVLQAFNGPKPVQAHTTGALQALLVREGQAVSAHATLAYVESQAEPLSVLAMAAWADTLSRQLATGRDYSASYSQFTHLNQHALGEVQEAFQTFATTYYQFLALRTHSFNDRKQKLLATELTYLRRQHQSLSAQQALRRQELEIAQTEFASQQLLYQQGVTSLVEYRAEKVKLLSKRLVPEQVQNAVTDNLAQQVRKEQEIMSLDQVTFEQRATFQSALNAFRSTLAAWQRQYVVTAPVTGTVHFASWLQPNQLVKASTVLFYVTPEKSQIYGDAKITQAAFGKVRLGQAVNVTFKGYPFQQFGLVRGRLSFIASLPSADGSFQALVQFPAGLRTTHAQQLREQIGMQGTAEIITADRRLLERFTDLVRRGQ